MPAKKQINQKLTTKDAVKKPLANTNNDTDSEDNQVIVASPKTNGNDNGNDNKVAKKTPIKPNTDSDSDSDSNVPPPVKKPIVQESDESDSSESESESEATSKADKKNKKADKESYTSLVAKLDEIYTKKKDHTKVIAQLKETLAKAYKDDIEFDKEAFKIVKLLPKAHSEEVSKSAKQKSQRKGNGGFKTQIVPDVLHKFLVDNGENADECKELKRPELFKKLNNIFGSRNLRNGKVVTLDKKTCSDLQLDVSERVLQFSQVHPFIAEFFNN